MAITNFIPTIWSETLYSELNKNFIAVNHCNRDFEGDIKTKGNTVKICGVGDISVFDYTRSFYNNHIYLLENYTAEQAKSHGMAYYGNSTTLETLIGYVKKNISEEFLPEFLKENENG